MPRGQKPKQYAQHIVDAVASLYAEGKTQHEVALALGMTQKVVFNVMRRHGIKARVAARRDQWGDKNHAWKGDDATKHAFHRRLYSRHGKPDCCLVCGTMSAMHYDYANISGRYEDLDDYIALCRSCHWRYDGKVENITNNRRGAVKAWLVTDEHCGEVVFAADEDGARDQSSCFGEVSVSRCNFLDGEPRHISNADLQRAGLAVFCDRCVAADAIVQGIDEPDDLPLAVIDGETVCDQCMTPRERLAAGGDPDECTYADEYMDIPFGGLPREAVPLADLEKID